MRCLTRGRSWARSWVYPCACLRGYYPPDHIVKVRQVTEVVEQKHPVAEEAAP
jgi:hypothetical protein